MVVALGRWLSCLTLLQVLVALVFLRGFLLTRVELPNVSSCQPPASCASELPPAFSKAVVLIVDAVRYDFLCGNGSAYGTGMQQSLMPKTLELVRASGGAAIASKFVADTPTITMSRLKALLTGGLPTFLDVGQSFSASAISEDNLLQQLLARNKRLVMLGDDTWMQLAGGAFSEAHPYPSFNVHDLHTVDDGVWQHLLPLLDRPDSWDLLLAHWLGVDHAGHTHGVGSRQMEEKLAQMDQQVSSVMASLVSQAGPGGRYADTLLLVLSDHGQTNGGDHGGGTPAETDSILITASLRGMHDALQQQQQQQQQEQHAAATGPSSSSGGSSAAGTGVDAALLLRLMQRAGYTPQHHGPDTSTAGAAAANHHSVCGSTIPQIDLTPTLAHSLGVPTPYGNLGKVPPHLFAILAPPAGPGAAAAAAHTAQTAQASSASASKGEAPGARSWLAAYAAVLAANAAQVAAYLNTYAAVGGLPAGELAAANAMHQDVRALQAALLPGLLPPGGQAGGGTGATTSGSNDSTSISSTTSSSSTSSTGSSNSSSPAVPASAAQLEGLVASQLAFLSAAAALARRRFTLFQQGPLWAGCALGAALLGGQLWALRRAVLTLHPPATSTPTKLVAKSWPWPGTPLALFASLASFHALGLFSVGLLMGEGRLSCALLAAATLLLLRAALQAALRARGAARRSSSSQPGPHSSSSSSEGGAAAAPAAASNGSLPGTPQKQLQQQQQQQQQHGLSGVPGPDPWGSWWPCVQAVRAALGMLLCNALLQLLGLIDRAGQDPHDKTQPTSDLLVGPDAAWQRGAFLAATAGPLLGMWLLLERVSRLLLLAEASSSDDRSSGGRAAVQEDRGGAGHEGQQAHCGVVRLLRGLCGLQLFSLAGFWAAQLTGHSDASLALLAQQLQQQQQLWQHGSFSALARVLAALSAAVEAAGLQGPLGGLLALSLRLLLPRVVYMAALAAVMLVALTAFCRSAVLRLLRRKQDLTGQRGGRGAKCAGGCQAGSSSSSEGLVAWLWLCGCVAGAQVMVWGYKGPATMLLALLQGVGLCRLLRLQARAQAYVQQQQQQQQQPGVPSGGPGATRDTRRAAAAGVGDKGGGGGGGGHDGGACLDVVGAGAWGMMGLQLFFCSGHFCEFSGLQYASSFIGFDTMQPASSGSLLLLNTCGSLALSCLSLPVFLAACCSSGGVGGNLRAGLRQRVACGLLLINSMRCAAMVVSMVSAAVQQQHILLWAIFAPKLVFELWFMAVTDAAQLAVAGGAVLWCCC